MDCLDFSVIVLCYNPNYESLIKTIVSIIKQKEVSFIEEQEKLLIYMDDQLIYQIPYQNMWNVILHYWMILLGEMING